MVTVAANAGSSSRAADRTERWRRLAELLDRVDRAGLRSLSADELEALGRLYRRVTSDLAQARTLGLDESAIRYLNDLVGRAYGHVYVTTGRAAPSVTQFFTRELPRVFRRTLPFTGAAFGVFLVASIFAAVVTSLNRDYAEILLGPGAAEMLGSLADRHRGGKDWLPSDVRPIASSLIMTNNIQVSILAFALGIVGCLGTLYVMFSNGLMLGTVASVIQQEGVALDFWAFVAPHGVLELPAIFIAGGAGLLLGATVLNPGDYPRRVALRLAAADAIVLVLGVAAMLVAAGIIEGFFSPALLPLGVKYLLAALLATGEIAYFLLVGRGGDAERHRLPTGFGTFF